ncbi:Structural maintenance of chromosomes protein 2 [Portunus trituberculatus]|uniref:Structural maintenance of chromosomes protein 2 n=1 Tax=Portunus trituberculatus TaxID=210409 RepID=A0A5B7F1W0_PORTR|nr:Structural maintenance of chromosomes protein 2 [Portunus trituberculatus]
MWCTAVVLAAPSSAGHHWEVGKENVQMALSLVCYDSEVHKAMEWVFGSTFVCREMDSAMKVAFDKNIMRKTVTLEGDIFDPAGTLTGGIYGLKGILFGVPPISKPTR